MSHLDLHASAAAIRLRSWARTHLHRASAESGEGVISAAIVVLIMAIIGAAMWFAFNEVWEQADDRIQSEMDQIGT